MSSELSELLEELGENIAIGVLLILSYNAVRALTQVSNQRLVSLIIGVLFGAAVIATMSDPLVLPSGLPADGRTVFILVSGVFAGPLGAALTAAAALAYRLSLGGTGVTFGMVSIFVTGLVAGLAGQQYIRFKRNPGSAELFLLGFANTLLVLLTSFAFHAFAGAPALSPGTQFLALLIFPTAMLVLGSAMRQVHHRIWWGTQQRLTDIVETTADLVWETDEQRRFTFLSDRYFDMMGIKPSDLLGQTTEASGAHWVDAETRHTAAAAFAANKPYSNLLLRAPARDGTFRVFSLTGRPVFDGQGNFHGYRGTAKDITESFRLQEELRRSRDGLLRAQAIGHVGSAEIELETGKAIWSDEMYRMMGLDRSGGASLDRYIAHVHPDDRLAFEGWRDRSAQGKETAPLEFRFVRPDGQIRWFHREAELERDATGKPVILYTVQKDVTQKRLAENALRRILRAQRILSACNQLLIHADDEQQVVRDICRTICHVGGYALAWVGQVETDAAKTVTPLAACGIGGDDDNTYVRDLHLSWDEDNERGRGPSGRAIRSRQIVVERDTESASDFAPWLAQARAHGFRSTLSVPLRDGDSAIAVLGIYSTAPDAFDAAEIEMLAELGSNLAYGILGLRVRAARREAERKLRATQDMLSVVLDHTVDGLITIDERGDVLTFSRPAEAIFGFSASEVIGRNIAMLMPAPYGQRHDANVRQFLTTGLPGIMGKGREVIGRRKDGSIFPMDLQVDEIPGSTDGRRFVGTVRDISVRKETEQQLRQAQKMEAMGQLTGGVAHDFNNLLGVIMGRLELLDEDLEGSPSQQAAARACIKAVQRGATLTKSLLAFARRQALMPTELDLNSVVTDMEDMLQRTLGEAYEFQVNKGPDLWTTEVDPGQLQNALLNLLINARDAMPDGGMVTVTTSNAHLDASYANAHRDVTAGDYVLMSVTDTGVGMPPDVLKRAFEPFYTTKPTGKGSGLGLSMVYGFVKQSGGHVSISSEPGQGTTVRLYLPRKEASGGASAEAVNKAAGGHETILIVEDNDDLRDLTRLQLQRLGYAVFAAPHAVDGIALLDQHPETALILTDIVLPYGLHGPEMIDRIRVTLPGVAVVFMSGYNEQHIEIAKAAAGHKLRLLQKPFHIDDLAVQIREALDERSHAAAAPVLADVGAEGRD